MNQPQSSQSRKISVPLRLDRDPPQIDPKALDDKVTQEEFTEFWMQLRETTAKQVRLGRIVRILNLIMLFILVLCLMWAAFQHRVSGLAIILILGGYLVMYGTFTYLWDRRISNQRASFIRKQNNSVWHQRSLRWHIDNGLQSMRFPRSPYLVLSEVTDPVMDLSDTGNIKN